MVAIGPRVGGAHVDVNLKFDDSSLDALAKRIHAQLAAIGRSNRKAYQSIGRSAVVAWRSALGSILASAPLIGSAMSAATGAVTNLAGAIYSLGQTSFAALPLFTSLGIAGLTLSIGMRNFSAAVSEVDPKRLELLLKGMPESMQAAVMSTRRLNDEMRAAIWPKLFAGLADGIDSLRNTGVIQRGLGAMADSINGLVRGLLNYANSKQGLKTINTFLQNNARVFKRLSKAAVPFLDGFLRLVNALTPAALRLADRITDVAKRFQDWTKAEGFGKRIDDMMKRAEKTAGKLFDIFGNLYTALINIFNASNPATNTLLDMLVRVTERFKDFTASADGQNSIADWAMNSVDVLKQVGETIRAVFDVVSELADSRVIINFLETVENAFVILGQLPLDKMVDAFVIVADALQPVSSAFLAIIIGGAALNIFLGSLLGQLGGLFAVLGTFKGVKNILKGVFGAKGPGGHVKDVGKITGAFSGLSGILSKGLRFAGWAGLLIWIGTTIAKSDKLKGKLEDAFQAFKDLGGPLKEAFDDISTSLEPVFEALEPVFDLLDQMMALGIEGFLDGLTDTFESLGSVIEGVGEVLAGIIDFFVALVQLDWGGMWDGIERVFNGLGPLLEGLYGLLVPEGLREQISNALAGLGPWILGLVAGLVGNIVSFFVTLPSRLISYGVQALQGLGGAISRGIPGVLATVDGIVPRIVGLIAGLPARLSALGLNAIGRLGGALGTGIASLSTTASNILNGIVIPIATLPTRLSNLGNNAVQRLSNALKGGLEKVREIASRIYHAIINKVKDLPGEMLVIGTSIMTNLIAGIVSQLGPLATAMGKAADIAGKFWPGSPVREGPLTAWNYGGGATGGGRNVIDAIAGGLRNTDPIRKAMNDVASVVATSLIPTVGVGRTTETRRSGAETPLIPATAGGNVYINKMQPHNYGEFEKQMREKKRLAGLGGRPS